MARPFYDKQLKMIEGGVLKKYFSETKKNEPRLTRKKLAAEVGVSPAVYSQWVAGQTRIPDRHLVFLAKRLGFNAIVLRPELKNTYEGFESPEILVRLRQLSPRQRLVVTMFIDWLVENEI